MKIPTLLALVAALGWLGYSTGTTRDAAPKVLGKARSMQENAGDAAGQIGYRVVADRYPFSPESIDARGRLFEIRSDAIRDAKDPKELEDVRGDRILADRLWLEGDPYAGPLALAALTGFACLVGLLQGRSRVRGKSFLLLLVLGAAVAGTQIAYLQSLPPMELGRFGYAHLPWIVAGAALLTVLLLAVPRRSAE